MQRERDAAAGECDQPGEGEQGAGGEAGPGDHARDERDAKADREARKLVRSYQGKQGLGTAYLAGFRRALDEGAEFVFEMDADFSHDPSYLPALLAAAETRYDLALGSRYVHDGGTVNWGWIRQMISRGGNIYARAILDCR